MTEPLTPPECDLRDFAFMPLELRRLLTSETWVLGTAEEKVAAICLWLESWHQVPAASLPDNDRMLAHLSGAGSRWPKVAAHALRGWVKCSDGRLYHPVVAEKAIDAFFKKEKQRERSRKANAARWGAPPSGNAQGRGEEVRDGSKGEPSGVLQASHKDASSIQQGVHLASNDDPKGQGQGEGEGEEESSLRSLSPRASPSERDHFPDFWAAYPRKVGRGAAAKAFKAALGKGATAAEIAAGLNRQRWPDNPQFVPHPATWLNQSRWLDDPNAAAPPTAEPAGKLDWLWREMRDEGADGFENFAADPRGLIQ